MPVRVLHVVEAIGGGVARHVTDVVRYADGFEHEVALPVQRVGWTTDLEAEAAMRAAGAVVHRVEMRRLPAHPTNARAWLELRQLVRDRAPSIVHGHAAVGGALARLVSSPTPIRRIYTPHAIFPRWAALKTERMLGRRTHHLIAVSESERELAIRLRLVPADRIELIPNGITVEPPARSSRDLRGILDLRSDVPLVGFVGRLGPQKAPEVFVEACRRTAEHLPDVHFVLVGDGPLRQMVRRRVEESKIGHRLHLMAHVPAMEELMGQLDVAVLTSRYEGLPYVLIEAMRAGVPIVATDVIGNRDAVEHGVTGLLARPDDPDSISDAVRRLLTSPSTAAQFGRAGQARVRQYFDVRRMAQMLGELYQRSAAHVSGPA